MGRAKTGMWLLGFSRASCQRGRESDHEQKTEIGVRAVRLLLTRAQTRAGQTTTSRGVWTLHALRVPELPTPLCYIRRCKRSLVNGCRRRASAVTIFAFWVRHHRRMIPEREYTGSANMAIGLGLVCGHPAFWYRVCWSGLTV